MFDISGSPWNCAPIVYNRRLFSRASSAYQPRTPHTPLTPGVLPTSRHLTGVDTIYGRTPASELLFTDTRGPRSQAAKAREPKDPQEWELAGDCAELRPCPLLKVRAGAATRARTLAPAAFPHELVTYQARAATSAGVQPRRRMPWRKG